MPGLFDDLPDLQPQSRTGPLQVTVTPRDQPVRTGLGSWYSQHQGNSNWVDRGDRPGSNALGVPDERQGIALPTRKTLGQWFDVAGPDGSVHRLQQTDVGPARWTGRGIDISAAAADRMGYSPKNFPTDAGFAWRLAGEPPQATPVTNSAQAANAGPAGAAPRPGGLFDDLPDITAQQQRQVGSGEAFLIGAEQGVTANFADELRGVRAASGMQGTQLPHTALAARAVQPVAEGLVGLARLGYEYLAGGDEAAKRYAASRDEFRRRTKTAEEQQPGMTLAGNVAGAVALPIPGAAIARGASLPTRAAASALTGGTIGTVAGAGQGEGVADRLEGAATGAVGGTVLGAAAPVASKGIEMLGRGASAVARPIVNQLRSVRSPEDEAARRVTAAISRDLQTGSSGLSPAEFAANRAAGEPVSLMDIGGETTRALARSAANTSPEGRAAINQTIDARFEGQSGRLSEWLRGAFHYPDATAQQAALQDTARRVNRPAYARAYADPAGQSLWDEGFQQLTAAPVVQDAIRGAARTGANKAAVEGFRPPRNPFAVQDDGTLALREGVTPSLQFWDSVKRNLDDRISSLQRSGEREAARDAQQLRTALVDRLDEAVPSYQQARAGAAHFFGAESALEAGQNFVGASQRFGIPRAREALAKMSDSERKLFQDGYVSRLVERIDRVGDRRNVLNQIAQSGPARTELQVALGPQRAAELEARMRVEGIMDLARSALQGNSTTTRQLIELGLAGGTYTYGSGGNLLNPDPQAVLNAALVYGVARGKGRIDQRVSRHVAELLASNEPSKLQRGLKIITKSGMLDNLRRADVVIARAGAQQANQLPSVPSISQMRADEQPNK